MVFVGIGVLLLILKLAEVAPVAAWSWWIILSPLLCAVVWWSWADATGYTKRRAMERMEARKDERRRRNMDALGTSPKRRR